MISILSFLWSKRTTKFEDIKGRLYNCSISSPIIYRKERESLEYVSISHLLPRQLSILRGVHKQTFTYLNKMALSISCSKHLDKLLHTKFKMQHF